MLLGVAFVIAGGSYERIHRSKHPRRVMGILPSQFKEGETRETLGLTGQETFDIVGLSDVLKARQAIEVVATAKDGKKTTFTTTARIDTAGGGRAHYRNGGGILQTVLRRLLKEK